VGQQHDGVWGHDGEPGHGGAWDDGGIALGQHNSARDNSGGARGHGGERGLSAHFFKKNSLHVP